MSDEVISRTASCPTNRAGIARIFRWLAIYLCALVLCSCASPPQLPPEVDINPDAGRGGELFVNLRLENGEEMPFIVDTGSPGTLFDKTLTSKMGWRLPIGKLDVPVGGTTQKSGVYLEPKLYLGGTRLKTGSLCATYDFKGESKDVGHPLMGILAMDCLKHYCIQLDFQAGKMRFLDSKHLDVTQLGKPYPLKFWLYTPLYSDVVGLAGGKRARSLIDTGWNTDGSVEKGAIPGETNDWMNLPQCLWDGQTYTDLYVGTEGNILGLRFLARHLVTFDFPRRTMYLKRESIGPLPDPRLKTTRMEALDPLMRAVLRQDAAAAHAELVRIEQSSATELAKTVAHNLVATLDDKPKPTPADAPPEVVKMALGDARPELAEVGWLKPMANRIPLNGQIESPLLDSGKIYATGLYAHAHSRYVYDLNGKWKTFRGEAGLHTAFQPYARGIVFVIKTDGKEVFHSAIIRGSKHASYEIDVTGVKTLELIVGKADDKNGGNWGLWLDPMLYRESSKNTDGHQ
jgi:NPCBM/NEW2 domain